MRKVIQLLFILVLSVSCRFKKEAEILKTLKISKDEVATIIDLNLETQLTIKEYFKGFTDLTYLLSTKPKLKRFLHRKLKRNYRESFCENFILANDDYEYIMKACRVDGFFLCADEVRFYKPILNVMLSLLKEKDLKKITRNLSCNLKLKNLGVLNE
jgi:hypothetical protein